MGYRIEDECVGCPQGCVNCGRKRVEVYFCDKCDTDADEYEPLYEYNGKELCFDCLKDSLNQIECDDCDSERCAECGYDIGTLYDLEGEWLCDDCLQKRLDADYKMDLED